MIDVAPCWVGLVNGARGRYKKKLMTSEDITELNEVINTSRDVSHPALEKLIEELKSERNWNLETRMF